MKITFIGVGSALSRRLGNASLLLETDGRRLLVDCGRTVPDDLAGRGIKWHDIEAIYVSHAHGDHAGGLEDCAFSRMYIPPVSRPALFAERNTLRTLWDHTLKGGMEPGKQRLMLFDDYFDLHPVDGAFEWAGVRFELLPMQHLMPSYGLWFMAGGTRILFSSDAAFAPALTDQYDRADVIFQDCEITEVPSGVHAHYRQLRELPGDVKKRMYLYHYQDIALPDAQADGFAGFVEKGRLFQF